MIQFILDHWSHTGLIVGVGFLDALTNFISGRDTNRSQETMAANQMDFQKEMSNTAHQREVNDLKAAGLNPTLSASGSGASSPAGAQASLTAPKLELTPLIMGAMSLFQKDRELAQTDARIKNENLSTAADVANKTSDTDLKRTQKILNQKGMLRADLEGRAAKKIDKMIQWLQQSNDKGRITPEKLQNWSDQNFESIPSNQGK